jgi:hypothetical protein
VAVAYLQEFEIQGGDTSTTNYDALNSALNLQEAPDGLLIHTAGSIMTPVSFASSMSGRRASMARSSSARSSLRSSSGCQLRQPRKRT